MTSVQSFLPVPPDQPHLSYLPLPPFVRFRPFPPSFLQSCNPSILQSP